MDCGYSGFPAGIPLDKDQNKELSSLSGTVNHSRAYHKHPDSVSMSQEGELKVAPTHGSESNIIIASFTGTRVCRAGDICSITFPRREQELLTFCITQQVIAWTHEQETGGSTNRLRDAIRGRNQLHCLFTSCLCLSPGPVLHPSSSFPLETEQDP